MSNIKIILIKLKHFNKDYGYSLSSNDGSYKSIVSPDKNKDPNKYDIVQGSPGEKESTYKKNKHVYGKPN